MEPIDGKTLLAKAHQKVDDLMPSEDDAQVRALMHRQIDDASFPELIDIYEGMSETEREVEHEQTMSALFVFVVKIAISIALVVWLGLVGLLLATGLWIYRSD